MSHEEDIQLDFYVEKTQVFIFVLSMTASQFKQLKDQLKTAGIEFDYLEK